MSPVPMPRWLARLHLRRHGLPDIPETRHLLQAAWQTGFTFGTAPSQHAMRAIRREAHAAVIRTLHDDNAHEITEAITDLFPWARHLTEAERAQFAAELTRALPEDTEPRSGATAREIVAGWHATARINAHTELRTQAQTPTEGDFGPVETTRPTSHRSAHPITRQGPETCTTRDQE